MREKVREADIGLFKGVSSWRLQERYGGTMGEKVREAENEPFKGVIGRRLQ